MQEISPAQYAALWSQLKLVIVDRCLNDLDTSGGLEKVPENYVAHLIETKQSMQKSLNSNPHSHDEVAGNSLDSKNDGTTETPSKLQNQDEIQRVALETNNIEVGLHAAPIHGTYNPLFFRSQAHSFCHLLLMVFGSTSSTSLGRTRLLLSHHFV
jgi:hypothetical protein